MKISLMCIMKRVLMGVVPKKPLVVLKKKKKKYEFTGETKEYDGVTLHRIRALRDFSDIKAGDLGGWIEKEENLSHEGNCWVANEACVYGDARVYGDVKVYGDACVFENVRVYGYAHICGHSQVYGNVQVSGNAQVCGDAHVHGHMNICGDAVIKEKMDVQYSECDTDLTMNLVDSIRCQTGLHAFGDHVIAFKHVYEDLSSMYDPDFKYVVGEWIEAVDPDMDKTESCVSGLHVSNATYWEGHGGDVLLMCKVMLEDIIAVQRGKIRCKKLYVMDSSSEGVR